jgi:hypothetical protein
MTGRKLDGARRFKSSSLQQPDRFLLHSPEPRRDGILRSSEELFQQVFVKNKCQMPRSSPYGCGKKHYG